jgi:ADP-ribose pyrophosphatase
VAEKKLEKWQVKDSNLLFDHRWAKVRRDSCILPDGSEIDDYYYWEGNDFAQVFALTSENKVILVRQYKHGVKEIVLELPAGMIESVDGDPLIAAQRELLEETGFEAESWQSLGVLHVSSAKATTRAYPFLAQNAQWRHSPSLDDTEDIQVIFCSIPEILNLIAEGSIRDSHSIATCFKALRALERI